MIKNSALVLFISLLASLSYGQTVDTIHYHAGTSKVVVKQIVSDSTSGIKDSLAAVKEALGSKVDTSYKDTWELNKYLIADTIIRNDSLIKRLQVNVSNDPTGSSKDSAKLITEYAAKDYTDSAVADLVSGDISGKVNTSDTADMLEPYQQKVDALDSAKVAQSFLLRKDTISDDGFISKKKLRDIIGASEEILTVSEPSPIGGAFGYNHTSSTFSGEGWSIGNPQNFNQVTFKIKARADISLIKTVIKTVNKSGTIIASKDVSISILNGVEQLVTVQFDSVITNSSGTQLYFMFAANSFCSSWSVTNAYSPFPYPTYSVSSWTTNGSTNFSNFNDVSLPSTSSLFLYTKIELDTLTGIAPNSSFSEKVATASTTIQQNKTDINFAKPTAEIVMPSRIFAIEGKETNIYFADIVYSNLNVSDLNYNVTCTKGSQYEKFWRVTPVEADTGSYSLKIDVIWNKQIIATKTTTLYIVSDTASTGISRSVIGVGNSTLSSGQPLSTLISENSSDVMTVTFKGTKGSGANKHEGISGWKIEYFAGPGITYYKYTLSGVTVSPGIGSYYSDGTNTFQTMEVNLTDGSGYVSMMRMSGSGTSASSGTLTKISGTGDATITYSEWVTSPSNPFWNESADSLDFANYLTANSITMTSGDWVFISLGINDVFSYTDSALLATQINTMVTNLRAIMTNMHSAVSGLRIAICIEIPPTISQDGFGANYGSGQTLYQYSQNIKTWQKREIAEFDNDTERTAGNFLIPWNAVVDRENNMQKSTRNANARNSTQIETYTNGVHPAQSGYDQMGDQLWAFLKYMR